jgi:hypothetical protein
MSTALDRRIRPRTPCDARVKIQRHVERLRALEDAPEALLV